MGKTLIITEKPSVAREYAAILNVRGNADGRIENDSYVITWCVGHLVAMCYPEKYDMKYKKWKMEDLPFLPDTYRYEVISSSQKQYEIVHQQLHRKDIDTVLYAGDSGREGEVIIQLIRDFGGVREGMEERRVWIDSCTEEEIRRGIREAKDISAYDNLADAGIMRAIEDYAMGINFSRALSVKYGYMLNQEAGTKKYTPIAVGRVMTCVLGMVVRREREIRNFKETEFFRVIGTFAKDNASFDGEWKAMEGSRYFGLPCLYKENGFLKKEDAEALINELQGKEAEVLSVEKSKEKKKPPLLFNLAELQAECSKRFKITPEQTLAAAQNLYERKFTTYPRTDARVLSTAIAGEIEKNLKGLKNYAALQQPVEEILNQGKYKGLEKTPYVNDKKITDHYAIIPTGVVNGLDKMSKLEQDIFELIARRFVSIFFPPAVFRKAALTIGIGTERFLTRIKVREEEGYFKIQKPDKPEKKGEEEEEEMISSEELLAAVEAMKKGDFLTVSKFTVKNGKTTPPKRYTSGTMILAMENAGKLIEEEELRAEIEGAGIGTSATRAGIIEKLVRNRYLVLNKKSQVLTPGRFGEMIFEVVRLTLPAMLEPRMTASWEKGLAKVERGEIGRSDFKEKMETYVRAYINNIKSVNQTGAIRQAIRTNIPAESAKKAKE
jgi:DNA topoisomerase-3